MPSRAELRTTAAKTLVHIRKEQAITMTALKRRARASDQPICRTETRDKQQPNRCNTRFLRLSVHTAHAHICSSSGSSVALSDASFYRFAQRFALKCFDFVEWCVIFINTLMSLQNLNKSFNDVDNDDDDDKDDERKRPEQNTTQKKSRIHIDWNWWSTIRRYSCHHL